MKNFNQNTFSLLRMLDEKSTNCYEDSYSIHDEVEHSLNKNFSNACKALEEKIILEKNFKYSLGFINEIVIQKKINLEKYSNVKNDIKLNHPKIYVLINRIELLQKLKNEVNALHRTISYYKTFISPSHYLEIDGRLKKFYESASVRNNFPKKQIKYFLKKEYIQDLNNITKELENINSSDSNIDEKLNKESFTNEEKTLKIL